MKLTIKKKIISLSMMTCLLALVLTSLTLIFCMRGMIKRQTKKNMNVHATMIADNCKASLAFNDPHDAHDILHATHAIAGMQFAAIFDKDGKFFASCDDAEKKLGSNCSIRPDGSYFENGSVTTFKKIKLNNEIIGTVCFSCDLELMNKVHKSLTFIVIGAGLIAFLAAYLVATRLQKWISGPILQIAQTARYVSQNKDYSVRAKKASSDEIGWLTDAFNEMLEMVHRRDIDQSMANDLLESKVRQRTEQITEANGKLQKEIEFRIRAEETLKQMVDETETINRKLESAVKEANNLAREAETANKLKSEFLANMSHEIRTPMNAIIGFGRILAEEQLSPEQTNYVDIITSSSENLLLIINDILDFSKIEAGKLTIDIIDCSIAEVLQGISGMVEQKAAKKGLDFGIFVHDNVSPVIRTDPLRLRQCLINLVGNAIKFTREGFVHIFVAEEDSPEGRMLRLDVKDSGIGISPEKQELIFQAFAQADGSTTRQYGGTGLGLAITKQLVKLLDGDLVLESQTQEGSTFTLLIPVMDVERDELNAEKAVDGATPVLCNEDALSSGTILIAEDIPQNQMLIKILVEKTGLEADIAADGLEAVRMASEKRYDLILMDIHMPGINGYEATKRIKQRTPEIPIIALTANAMKGDDEKCFAAGCDAYLSKPIDSQALNLTIKKYLAARQDPARA